MNTEENSQKQLTAAQAKRVGKPKRKEYADPEKKSARLEALCQRRLAKEAFVAQNKEKVRNFLSQGIDPKKRVHIVTDEDQVLLLIGLNPETGIACCRSTWHNVGVKFDKVVRIAEPHEVVRLKACSRKRAGSYIEADKIRKPSQKN